MSKVLVSTEICAEALGAIGQFPVSETAPQGEHLRRAMTWLDMLLAEMVGTERMFSRFDATLTMPITNGTGTYDLYDALGDELPDDGIQYVVEAWLEDSAGNRSPVEIVTRRKFEDVAKPAETGVPCWAHIDRIDGDLTLRIYPVPASTDTTSYSLKLVGQRFAPNVAPAGVTGTKPINTTLHRMGEAWQRWLVVQLAHDLGCGPIHKLPEPSLNRFAGMAATAKARLLAFENREHETTAPVCEPWGL